MRKTTTVNRRFFLGSGAAAVLTAATGGILGSSMDYVAIGQALRAAGFSGDAVIELAHERNFRPTRPLRDSLRMSRAYVRKTLGF